MPVTVLGILEVAICCVVECKPVLETYPYVPSPAIVLGILNDTILLVVETKLATMPVTVLGILEVAICCVVECKPLLETYPYVPRPAIVLSIPEVLTIPLVAKPITEEVNSVGSINELIYVSKEQTVEASWEELT